MLFSSHIPHLTHFDVANVCSFPKSFFLLIQIAVKLSVLNYVLDFFSKLKQRTLYLLLQIFTSLNLAHFLDGINLLHSDLVIWKISYHI